MVAGGRCVGRWQSCTSRLPAGPLSIDLATRLSRADVEAAASWLRGRVVRTPVVHTESMDRIAGRRLWLKAENLQTTGSYKFRGALRAIGRIARERLVRGVIAQSTGNHAIAVAVAAGRYDLAATLVLPVDAPPTKIAAVQEAGARIVMAGTTLEERIEMVEQLHAATGHEVVDAYDHADVIAGQGTATWELIEQAARRGIRLDSVVVPVGGGGGVAGACLAVQGGDVAVYGAEPVGCDSLRRSLAGGQRTAVQPAATLADGLRPSMVGRLPFDITRSALAGVVTVDDEAIGRALALALFHSKVLIEPSAAAGLAAALNLAATTSFDDIGVVLTGGNADPPTIAQLVAGFRASPGRDSDGPRLYPTVTSS